MINISNIRLTYDQTYDQTIDTTSANAAQYGEETSFKVLDPAVNSNFQRCEAFPIHIITNQGSETLHLNSQEKDRLYKKLREDVSQKNNKTMFVAESLLHRDTYGLPSATLAMNLLIENPTDNLCFPVHDPKEIIINAKDPKRIKFTYSFEIQATETTLTTEKVVDTIFYKFGFAYTDGKIEILEDSIQSKKATRFLNLLGTF